DLRALSPAGLGGGAGRLGAGTREALPAEPESAGARVPGRETSPAPGTIMGGSGFGISAAGAGAGVVWRAEGAGTGGALLREPRNRPPASATTATPPTTHSNRLRVDVGFGSSTA